MLLTLNLDPDIASELARKIDVNADWFTNLPASVQFSKLSPYVEKQRRRDQKRLRMKLAA